MIAAGFLSSSSVLSHSVLFSSLLISPAPIMYFATISDLRPADTLDAGISPLVLVWQT